MSHILNFNDFNDEGPGTYEWDFVLGKNTTGLFADEDHYVIFGNTIKYVNFSYAGGIDWKTTELGSWPLTYKKQVPGGFIVEFDYCKYKAVVSNKFKIKGGMVVDLEDI